MKDLPLLSDVKGCDCYFVKIKTMSERDMALGKCGRCVCGAKNSGFLDIINVWFFILLFLYNLKFNIIKIIIKKKCCNLHYFKTLPQNNKLLNLTKNRNIPLTVMVILTRLKLMNWLGFNLVLITGSILITIILKLKLKWIKRISEFTICSV